MSSDREKHESLEAERDFLLRSLDDLEDERQAGNVDDGTYREDGHVQVDFGLDTPFLYEEGEFTPVVASRWWRMKVPASRTYPEPCNTASLPARGWASVCQAQNG